MLTVSYIIMNVRDNKRDGTRTVYITPSHTESTASSSGNESKASEEDSQLQPIDINQAGHEDLIALPGIGDVLADAILEYRKSNGDFNNIEEIMLVNGIGEGIFNNIKDYIYVKDPVYTSEVEIESETVSEIVTQPKAPTTHAPTQITTVIPHETEETVPETEYTTVIEDVAPIDLNTADKETLLLLPYVDEIIADRIIELRDSINGFSNSYELLYVEGLSRNQVAEITEYVTVQPPETELHEPKQ